MSSRLLNMMIFRVLLVLLSIKSYRSFNPFILSRIHSLYSSSNLLMLQRQDGVPLRSSRSTSDYLNEQKVKNIDSFVSNSGIINGERNNVKSYGRTDTSTTMGPKSSTRYQGRNKGSNKHYFESRHRQLDAVLLVVRNQTRARIAFTLTDVSTESFIR